MDSVSVMTFNLLIADDTPAQPQPLRRIIPKSVMDPNGTWITVPYIIWRDDRGWHDKPTSTKEANAK